MTIEKIEAALQLRANEPDGPEGYGFSFNFNRHPESDIYRSIERLVGMGERGVDITADPVLQKAGERFNELVALVDQDDMTGAKPYTHRVKQGGNWVEAAENAIQNPPQPIPTGIRSAMTLAEYYFNTQGDVAQTIEAPIDLSISDLEISVPADESIEKRLKDLYGPEKLNMKYILYQIMMNSGVFGSAYPMEVPDDADNPSEIRDVILLPPKFMWVGYHMVNGLMVSSGLASPYAMRPWNGAANWTKEMAAELFMPMTYNAFASNFNEQIPMGWGLPVNPYYLHPVRAKSFHWNRYPLPPISKAFRSISTRAIYQEMRRGLLEGYKNQLWVFILGTDKVMPSPQEMLSLKNTINGISGERTGSLVWRHGLEVSVKAPAVLADAISNEVAQAFKVEIFSDLGCNIRLTTGNKVSMPGSGAGDSGVEVDLSVWLRRLEFIRKNMMDWEYLFRMRQADRWDGRTDPDQSAGPARRALETAQVKFSRSLLEIAEEIKQVVLPLYTVGLTSPQTALKRADEDYATELKYKQQNRPNQDLFFPPPSFNQTTTADGGSGPATSKASSVSPGRPVQSAILDPLKLTADLNESETRRQYFAAILAALHDDLWGNGDVDSFVADLKALNADWLGKIGAETYTQAGGVGTLDPDRSNLAASYVNAYADNFGDDLKAMIHNGEPVGTEAVRRRTLHYPQEGFKSATINATNQAMSERGASHWRRVLHPELSQRGPCPSCIADSQVVHGMDEPFSVMHPHDVCGEQELGIQYFTNGLPSIEVPTPNAGNELAQELFGTRKAGRTRRKRI